VQSSDQREMERFRERAGGGAWREWGKSGGEERGGKGGTSSRSSWYSSSMSSCEAIRKLPVVTMTNTGV